jgi:hypothetical protein
MTYRDNSSFLSELKRCLMVSCSLGKADIRTSKSDTRRALPVQLLRSRPTRICMSGTMFRPGRAQCVNMASFHVEAGFSFRVWLAPIEDPDHPIARFTAVVSTFHSLLEVPTYSNLHALIELWCDLAFSLQSRFVRKLETFRRSLLLAVPISCLSNPISIVVLGSMNESKKVPGGKDLSPGCAGVQCI